MFGINGSELAVILVVAALVLGPRNIAQGIKAFRALVQSARSFSSSLRAEVSDQIGSAAPPAASVNINAINPATALGVDLQSLNLQSYNPKDMVRKAVREEMNAWMRDVDLASLADLAAGATAPAAPRTGAAATAPAPQPAAGRPATAGSAFIDASNASPAPSPAASSQRNPS